MMFMKKFTLEIFLAGINSTELAKVEEREEEEGY